MLIKSRYKSFKNDILAGLTVSLAIVPEVIAFAFVAGIDPSIALQASIILGLCASIFGGRPGMISGAAGSTAVVLAALVITHGVQYLFATIVLMGIIQILIGVFKLGKFARMIPHPVILGFVNGLAIVIFLAQLNQFKIDGIWMKGTQLYLMLGLVLLTMFLVFIIPKFTKAIPSSLIAIIVTTGITLFLGKHGYHLPDVKEFSKGEISASLPHFHIPMVPFNIETLKIIFPYALTVALVGLIESLLTLSLIDDLTDTRGKGNKECIGQGIGNLVSGLFGGTGGCAMIGQSIINISSNGRGRLSGISMALSLAFFLVFGSKILGIIPLAALVGVMFMVVIETFAWESLTFRKKIPTKDIAIILIVAIITVVDDLATGVIVGVIVSALIFAWEKGKKINATVYFSKDKTIKTYSINGPVFFGSAASFKELFDPKNDPDVVYIDFANSFISDHSAIEAINTITEKYSSADKKITLKHLSHDCLSLIKNADKIIEVNILEDPKYHVADDSLA